MSAAPKKPGASRARRITARLSPGDDALLAAIRAKLPASDSELIRRALHALAAELDAVSPRKL
jgi:hypothetical protein